MRSRTVERPPACCRAMRSAPPISSARRLMYSMSAMARSQLIPGFQLSRLGSIGIERTPPVSLARWEFLGRDADRGTRPLLGRGEPAQDQPGQSVGNDEREERVRVALRPVVDPAREHRTRDGGHALEHADPAADGGKMPTAEVVPD